MTPSYPFPSGSCVFYRADSLDARCASAVLYEAVGAMLRYEAISRDLNHSAFEDVPCAVLIGLDAPAAMQGNKVTECLTIRSKPGQSLVSAAWSRFMAQRPRPRWLAHFDERFAGGDWAWGTNVFLRSLADERRLEALASKVCQGDDEDYFHALEVGRVLIERDRQQLQRLTYEAVTVSIRGVPVTVGSAPRALNAELAEWLTYSKFTAALVWTMESARTVRVTAAGLERAPESIKALFAQGPTRVMSLEAFCELVSPAAVGA